MALAIPEMHWPTWSDFDPLPSQSKKRKSEPQPEPPVILPKEILAGARKLEAGEIDAAVLKAVDEAKNKPTQDDAMRNALMRAQMMAMDPWLSSSAILGR